MLLPRGTVLIQGEYKHLECDSDDGSARMANSWLLGSLI